MNLCVCAHVCLKCLSVQVCVLPSAPCMCVLQVPLRICVCTCAHMHVCVCACLQASLCVCVCSKGSSVCGEGVEVVLAVLLKI